jgi:hypothetical protein
MPKKKIKWFEPGKRLNWSKTDTQAVRRRNALNSRHGSYLRTARALQALANITQDKDTKRKADADAAYFFSMHNRRK